MRKADTVHKVDPTPRQIALAAAVRRSPLSQSKIAEAAGMTKRTLQRYLDGTRTPVPATHDAVLKACNLVPSVGDLLAEHSGDALIGSPSHFWLQDFLGLLIPSMLAFDQEHSMPIDPRSAKYCANLIKASWIAINEKRLKFLSALYAEASKIE